LKRIIREEGVSAIVVEQHAQRILDVTDSAIILNRGAIVHASSSQALIKDPEPLAQHLGVAAKTQARRIPPH
jgi:branched-chain amino acid transport system ATP-binding protein